MSLEEPRRAGVYRIVNVHTGELYIGSALNMVRRWHDHRRRLTRGDHHSSRLQAAWAVCGAQAFAFWPLLVCDKEHLVFYEQSSIDVLRPALNIRQIARSNLGVKYSAESRAKMSTALKGNKCALGVKHSPETRRRMSLAKMGHVGAMWGKRHPDGTKAKMAAASRGKRHTPESRLKMSLAKRGVPVRPEVMERRRERYRLVRKGGE